MADRMLITRQDVDHSTEGHWFHRHHYFCVEVEELVMLMMQ